MLHQRLCRPKVKAQRLCRAAIIASSPNGTSSNRPAKAPAQLSNLPPNLQRGVQRANLLEAVYLHRLLCHLHRHLLRHLQLQLSQLKWLPVPLT